MKNFSDTRDRNKYFEAAGPKGYLEQYSVTLCNLLGTVDEDELRRAAALVSCARTCYVAGNGGSAATADHWVCDMTKGRTPVSPGPGDALRAVSLTAHTALITALANDTGYENIFTSQLRMAGAAREDVIVLISASGNSPNIVHTADWAREMQMPIIGMTGFDGGALRNLATVSLHIPFNNYGIVEDAHSALMHTLAQYLWIQRSPSFSKR